MPGKKRLLWVIALFFVIAVTVQGVILIRRGFSARDTPTALETYIARITRKLAVPSSVRGQKNPFTATPDVVGDARAHFADHCAICHANNGSGNTEIGQNLYPKTPDMRMLQTQNLSDGELYYIIHNGIRLTGMPAWGTAEKDDDSWKLVLFIRHLPQLTPEEEEEMTRLNPKSPAELKEDQEEQEFLNETEPSKRTRKTTEHHH
jgi:mono/diheme cytochrome c family protein